MRPTAPSCPALVERQVEAPDLDLVAVLERADVDPLPIHVRAVERARVAHDEAVALADDLAVPARHGDVVEEHRGVGVAADAGDVAGDEEVAPGVRAPGHVAPPAVARSLGHKGVPEGGVPTRRRLECRATRRAI